MSIPEQNRFLSRDFFNQWLVLALFLLVVCSLIVYNLFQEHKHIELRERERLSAQAKVIDENLACQLDGVGRALKGIRKELPLWKGKNWRESANLHLSALVEAMPGIRTFFITDAAGRIIATNQHQLMGQNIGYREYFQVTQKSHDPSSLFLSPPFRSTLGNFVINIALIIPGEKGKFTGIIAAALDPEYFNILLGSVCYAPDMWTGLAHGDGKLFLTVPGNDKPAGFDLTGQGYFFTRHMNSGLRATVFTGSILPAGEERMIVQRTIRPAKMPMDKPLVVAVSRNVPTLYADWRREARGTGVLFGVLVLTMTSALYFSQRRQQAFALTTSRYLEELLQTKDSALRANEAKSRFLATVAHEFRTPLSLLTSSTDILDRYSERLSLEEKTQQHDYIRNAARQMSGLIDTVLSFNRLDGQCPHHNPVAVNIGHFFLDLAEQVKTVWCNDHRFTVSISDDCGTALFDEIFLRQIVENLLTNAFRYTPDGGSVVLLVDREHDRLHVTVTDSGISIPEEDHTRIFEAFYRSRNVEARRGLGLGLSIVHEALVRMGGTITVDSTIEKGTTMRIEIPVIDPSGPEEQTTCIQS